jgi:hypothetical protein
MSSSPDCSSANTDSTGLSGSTALTHLRRTAWCPPRFHRFDSADSATAKGLRPSCDRICAFAGNVCVCVCVCVSGRARRPFPMAARMGARMGAAGREFLVTIAQNARGRDDFGANVGASASPTIPTASRSGESRRRGCSGAERCAAPCARGSDTGRPSARAAAAALPEVGALLRDEPLGAGAAAGAAFGAVTRKSRGGDGGCGSGGGGDCRGCGGCWRVVWLG